MLGLKLNHVSKSGSWEFCSWNSNYMIVCGNMYISIIIENYFSGYSICSKMVLMPRIETFCPNMWANGLMGMLYLITNIYNKDVFCLDVPLTFHIKCVAIGSLDCTLWADVKLDHKMFYTITTMPRKSTTGDKTLGRHRMFRNPRLKYRCVKHSRN